MTLGEQAGGAEALFGHLMRHKSDRYHYVCGFLKDGPLVGEMRALGYDTVVFHATRLSDVSNYLLVVKKIRAWIRDKRLDLVMSWMSKGQFYVGPAAIVMAVPVVWFQHSVPVGSAFMDRLITLIPVDAVFCCSRTSKTSQDRLFPHRRSHVCYPGVVMRTDQGLSQREARRELGLPSDIPVIGMVARLERWKGAHIFVEASQKLLGRNKEVMFFIVGGAHASDSLYADEIRAMVDHLDSGERFVLAGQRSMQETLLWQTAADIIVQPVTGIEPFGMAIVEAMAQGKIVVTSDIGGPTEIIEDGVSGILIKSSNPDLLASSLVDLLADPVRRGIIQKGAAIRGRSFTIEAFVSRVEELLQSLLPSIP